MAKTKKKPVGFLSSVLSQSVTGGGDVFAELKEVSAVQEEEIESGHAQEMPESTAKAQENPESKRPPARKERKPDPQPAEKKKDGTKKKAGRPPLSYNPAVHFNVNGTDYVVENPGQVKRDKLVAYVPEDLKDDFTRACFANGQNVSAAINFLAKVYVEETFKQIHR